MCACYRRGQYMSMLPFTTLTGTAAPLLLANVDTDVIIRIERLTAGDISILGHYAFEALRYAPDGSERPDFILNQPPFRGAPILLAGANFGCGSSREGAVFRACRPRHSLHHRRWVWRHLYEQLLSEWVAADSPTACKRRKHRPTRSARYSGHRGLGFTNHRGIRRGPDIFDRPAAARVAAGRFGRSRADA